VRVTRGRIDSINSRTLSKSGSRSLVAIVVVALAFGNAIPDEDSPPPVVAGERNLDSLLGSPEPPPQVEERLDLGTDAAVPMLDLAPALAGGSVAAGRVQHDESRARHRGQHTGPEPHG